MATAYVEYAHPALKSPYGSSIHGPCFASEALAISVSTVTGAAPTELQVNGRDVVTRISAMFVRAYAKADEVGSSPPKGLRHTESPLPVLRPFAFGKASHPPPPSHHTRAYSHNSLR